MKQFRSLRVRMTAAVTVAFAVWMFVVGAGLLSYTHRVARRDANLLLRATADNLRRDLAEASHAEGEDPAASEHRPTEQAYLTDFMNEHRDDLAVNHLALLIVNAEGRVVERFPQSGPAWPSVRQDEWQLWSVPAGSLTLVLGYDWGRTEATQNRQALVLFALSLCGVLGAALGAWVLVGRSLSPISRLSRQAREASAQTLRLRLQAPSSDAEIVDLVSTLNGLLSRLGETATAQGRFYAAASHELRTPLQALSGHLEVALTRTRSAEEYRTTLEEAHRQARRLISLTQDLLFLGQLGAAGTLPPRELVSTAEVCRRVLSQLQPTILERGLQLEARLELEGEILCPPSHVEVFLRNVLENAVNYATAGGTVRVILEERPDEVLVETFNTYPLVPDWDPEAWFEPFSRREGFCSAGGQGHGLGLSICKALAAANDWGIALSHDGHGVVAQLILSPRADWRGTQLR